MGNLWRSRNSYCFGHLADSYRYEIDGLWEETIKKAGGSTSGLSGGVGIKYLIYSSFSLRINGELHRDKISNFWGRFDYKNSVGWKDYYEGSLYYYETDLAQMGLRSYSTVMIIFEKPSSNLFHNVRKTVLDLSGFSLQLGFEWQF